MIALAFSVLAAAACSINDGKNAPPACPADRDASIADPNYDEAVAAVDSWIAQHPSGWSLQVSETDAAGGFLDSGFEHDCSSGAPFASARLNTHGLALLIHFNCSILGATTIEQIRAAYSHTTIDALPLGIAVPDWHFHYMTPVSSFTAGVEFVRWDGGLLEVRIDTMMYAIYGWSNLPQCGAPADGSTPACCYVQREHRIALSLSLSAPFDPSVLR